MLKNGLRDDAAFAMILHRAGAAHSLSQNKGQHSEAERVWHKSPLIFATLFTLREEKNTPARNLEENTGVYIKHGEGVLEWKKGTMNCKL